MHVPIVFTGEDIAAKSGGVVVKVLHELKWKDFPKIFRMILPLTFQASRLLGGMFLLKIFSSGRSDH